MKILTALLLSFLTTQSYAATSMRPGLWELKMNTSVNGKANENPFAKINKLPKEQREAILKTMKMQTGSTPNTQRVCYSKEDIEKYSTLGTNNPLSQHCEQKVHNLSSSVTKIDFNCKDGHKGTATITYESPKKVSTINEGTNAKGDKILVKSNAKFISDNCSTKL